MVYASGLGSVCGYVILYNSIPPSSVYSAEMAYLTLFQLHRFCSTVLYTGGDPWTMMNEIPS